MPVAADVLQGIAGFLQGVNQQGEANQAKQLQALQLLAQQPGTTIGPAAQPQRAGFLSTLLGKPYQAGPGGAPVASIGGQAFTANKLPTLAEALPDLFQAPPEGMAPFLNVLSTVPATVEAQGGLVTLLQKAQADRAAAAREAARAARDDRRYKDTVDYRTRVLEGRERAQAGTGKRYTEGQQNTLLSRVQKAYAAAGVPVPEGAATASPEELRRLLAQAPPKARTGGAGALTANAVQASLEKTAGIAAQNGVILPPELLEKAWRDPSILLELRILAGVPPAQRASAQTIASNMRREREVMRRVLEGGRDEGGLLYEALSKLTDPKVIESRTASLETAKRAIIANARALLLMPGFEDIARAELEALGVPVPAVSSAAPATQATATVPAPQSDLPVSGTTQPLTILGVRRLR